MWLLPCLSPSLVWTCCCIWLAPRYCSTMHPLFARTILALCSCCEGGDSCTAVAENSRAIARPLRTGVGGPSSGWDHELLLCSCEHSEHIMCVSIWTCVCIADHFWTYNKNKLVTFVIYICMYFMSHVLHVPPLSLMLITWRTCCRFLIESMPAITALSPSSTTAPRCREGSEIDPKQEPMAGPGPGRLSRLEASSSPLDHHPEGRYPS